VNTLGPAMTKQTNRKPGATAAASVIAPDAFTRITNRIVADLEQGVRPWCKPWGGAHSPASAFARVLAGPNLPSLR
jgi:antirestriction protein ArdC